MSKNSKETKIKGKFIRKHLNQIPSPAEEKSNVWLWQDIPDRQVLRATYENYENLYFSETIDILLDQNDSCFKNFLKNVQREPSGRQLVSEKKNAKNRKKRLYQLFSPYVNLHYLRPIAVTLSVTASIIFKLARVTRILVLSISNT